MPKYNVHLFREMRLYFPGIEAESQAEAARIASETDTCEAEEVEDCNGAELGAMVDVVGNQGFAQSALIDFEPARMAKLTPDLVAALKTVVEMEYDRDEESRNFDEERLQHFSSLIAQATGTATMTPGVPHATGGQDAALLAAAKAALADLQGLMPEFEPSGDRLHPGWKTIEELKSALGQATTIEQKSATTATAGIPTETPWGKPDTIREIAPGIIRYDTPSHGGYYLTPERVAEMLPCLRAFKPFAGANWFEEDCDWSIVALAFPQFFPEDAIFAALTTVKHYKPELFAELVKGIDLPTGAWQRKLTEQDKARAKRVAGLGT